MLKVANFSWLWVSWVSFAWCFFLFLSSCYFFFYSFTPATTWITTTITSNNISDGERIPKTSYKLWNFEFRNFGGKKERATPKLVLLLALGFGSMYTHTCTHTRRRFVCNTRYAPSDATPHTFVFLVYGFWG